MKRIHFCLHNVAGQLRQSYDFIYLTRQRFDRTLNLKLQFSLDLKKYSNGAVAWERRSCRNQFNRVYRNGSAYLYRNGCAFQNNYRGKVHSVCKRTFSLQWDLQFAINDHAITIKSRKAAFLQFKIQEYA